MYEKLPFILPEQYVFISNKELLNCEIKIDDKLSNLSGNAEKKILFTAYHNKYIDSQKLEEEGAIRANSWKDIEKILL